MPLASCSPPDCYLSRPRKRPGKRTLPPRCIKPNPWSMFLINVSGQGLDRKMVSYMYERWKLRFYRENPTLDESALKAKMNEELCRDIAESNRRARSRKSSKDLKETRERRRKTAKARTEARKSKDSKSKDSKSKESKAKVFFAERAVPKGWNLYKKIKNMEVFTLVLGTGRSRVSLSLHQSTLESMRPREWFNDDVITAYMALLQHSRAGKKNVFMNTLFYGMYVSKYDPTYAKKSAAVRHPRVAGMTRRLKTTDPVQIFVPVNHNNTHWTLIVIDVKNKQVISLDSLNKERKTPRREMLEWIEREHIVKGKPFNKKEWTTFKANAPSQTNGYDCGVFTCMFAAFLGNDRPITFKQKDLVKMRARLAWSVLNMKLE